MAIYRHVRAMNRRTLARRSTKKAAVCTGTLRKSSACKPRAGDPHIIPRQGVSDLQGTTAQPATAWALCILISGAADASNQVHPQQDESAGNAMRWMCPRACSGMHQGLTVSAFSVTVSLRLFRSAKASSSCAQWCTHLFNLSKDINVFRCETLRAHTNGLLHACWQ